MTNISLLTKKFVFNKLSDHRLIVDYLRALRNEIAIDKYVLIKSGFSTENFEAFPRPARWIKMFRQAPKISGALGITINLIWKVFAPLFFIFQYQKYKFTTKNTNLHLYNFDNDGQVLGFSSISADIVHEKHIQPVPKQWLELPWLPLKNLPKEAEIISVTHLLNKNDVKKALKLAILSHYLTTQKFEIGRSSLQTYTAWRWFLIRLAVDKLPGPLLTVEHFDRWAILVDSSIWRKRFNIPKPSLTLMQHGSIGAKSEQASLDIKLPTRLKAVNRLHVYSPVDESIFRKEVLSSKASSDNLLVSFFQPRIILSEVPHYNLVSILFVGHPLCDLAHITIFSELKNKHEFYFFYKQHPTIAASNTVKKMSWTFIEDKTLFPKVDLLISYPSTLVDQYKYHGISAFVHDIQINSTEAKQLVPKILRKLHDMSNVNKTDSNISGKN